jgi:patatin-related protein
MNGGVSLAVWMGGVTHELDLLRRASSGESEEGVDDADLPVFRLWQDLARQVGKTVKIDIVSGTSAGGLNGLLLATAVGRRAAQPRFRELWLQEASFDRLQPPLPGEESVLSGQKFSGAINRAIANIAEADTADEPITLFVTATALDGENPRFSDGFGNEFDVRDHRRAYRFRSDSKVWRYTAMESGWDFTQSSYGDFTAANTEALQQAGRATAGFPVAFAPVREDPMRGYRVRPTKAAVPTCCVMDGGVLDNAPFGPVLDEITGRRLLDKPVERILVYVVPSQGQLAEEKVKDLGCNQIPALTAGLNAMHYPQEADFRAATDSLRHRLQTAERGTREELFERMVCDPGLERKMRQVAPGVLREYRRSRLRGVVQQVLLESASQASVISLVSPFTVTTQAIDPLLKNHYVWLPPLTKKEPLPSPDLSQDWNWGISAAERLLQTLTDYLHERLISNTGVCGAASLEPAQRAEVMSAVKEINQSLRKVLAIREAAVTERQRRGSIAPGAGAASSAADLVNDVHVALMVPKALCGLIRTAADQFLKALSHLEAEPRWTTQEEVVAVCQTVEILTQTFAPPAGIIDRLTPKFRFLRLGPDKMGPLFNNAQWHDFGQKKLYGIRFGHFGAFMDEQWRRSDFTWGRLDAVHHLLPALLGEGEDPTGKEREFHEAILRVEGSSVEQMENGLTALKKDDQQLLDDRKTQTLQSAGDSAISTLAPKGWLIQHAGRWFWHRSLKKWRKAGQ